jgi:hypothetical protein
MEFQNAPNLLPKNKVLAASAGSIFSSIVFGVFRARGFELDPELEGSITILLTFLAGYFVPDRR